MRILNTTQMREADRRTIHEIGVPSIALMENAGRQVVDALAASLDDLAECRLSVLCGPGNNGGDGFVVARVLHERGAEALVFVVGASAEIRGDARVNLEILGRLGIPVVEIATEQAWNVHAATVAACDVIVDALLGTGLTASLAGVLETVVADVNGMNVPVVSVDLPSGLSADTHEVIGACVDATLTVTLAAPKLPLVLPPGAQFAGDLVVADIGIPHEVIDALDGPWLELVTGDEIRALIPPRAEAAHKGDFGHVLIVSGSVGKTGAAHLAAMGALRSGAGLVTVATPKSCQAVVAALGAEYMTEGLDETAGGTVAATAVERVLQLPGDVIAVGPGLGTGQETRAFVRALLDRAGRPLVMDADALNAFAGQAGEITGRDGRAVIITPHPGEMARLLGTSTEEVQARRVEAARALATANRLHVILKGHRTVIATPGGKVYINPTGNPGMASGGTGDVLTGMIAAWLGQLLDAEAACKLAVYLHGAAGDLAEADEGQVSLTAGDILSRLGRAVLELTATADTE